MSAQVQEHQKSVQFSLWFASIEAGNAAMDEIPEERFDIECMGEGRNEWGWLTSFRCPRMARADHAFLSEIASRFHGEVERYDGDQDPEDAPCDCTA